MSHNGIDEEIARVLEEPAATALAYWARMKGLRFGHVLWLVNGRSKATVGVVTEQDMTKGHVRLLVMKHARADGPPEVLEYPRHQQALQESGTFGEEHFSKIEHDPIAVDNGASWISFQTPAGDFEDYEVVTDLLMKMVHLPPRPSASRRRKTPSLSAEEFKGICRRIVSELLYDLAQKPSYRRAESASTAEAFLLDHLGDQLENRLKARSEQHAGRWIKVDREPERLPNPLAFVRGDLRAAKTRVNPLVGRTHGDVHTDNAVVKVRPRIEEASYFLIDNALYESKGPLTRDPIHLILYIVARTMVTMSVNEQDELIDLLVAPDKSRRKFMSGWLEDLVLELRDTAEQWALKQGGMIGDWRQQSLLSLVACALMYVGRTSTREEDQRWFLRLAARATKQYIEDYGTEAEQDDDEEPPLDTTGLRWIGFLCVDLPLLKTRLKTEEEIAELRSLVQAARDGKDRTDEYLELVRRAGGPVRDPRVGSRATTGQPSPSEMYGCPLDLCDRCERRKPGGPVPDCDLREKKPKKMVQKAQ